MDWELSGIWDPSLSRLCEHRTTIQGRIESYHVDDVSGGSSGKISTIAAPFGPVRLITVDPIPASAHGSVVSISGYLVDSTYLVAEHVEHLSQVNRQPPQGPFRVLFLLVTYPSSPIPKFGRWEIEDYILHDSSTVRTFFRESSYGKAEMTGDVYGWIELPDSLLNTVGLSGLRPEPKAIELERIVRENNIDLAGYQNVVWIQNLPSGWGWTFSGVSTPSRHPFSIAGKEYFLGMNWDNLRGPLDVQSEFIHDRHAMPKNLEWTICHELSHTMDLGHADTWDGDPGDDWSMPNMWQNASNPLDIMGYYSGGGHHNVVFKKSLGWLDSTSVLQIRSSGDYFIRALELQTPGIRAAEIRISDTARCGLFVEYRKNIGFDQGVNEAGILGYVDWGFLGIRIEENPYYSYASALLWLDGVKKNFPLLGQRKVLISRAEVSIGPILSVTDEGIWFHVDIRPRANAVFDRPDGVPVSMELHQNYPNPFNPSTSIRFSVPKRRHVHLVVFNQLGQTVKELVNESWEAGIYDVSFDGSGLSSGIYFYRLIAGDFVQTKKLILIK